MTECCILILLIVFDIDKDEISSFNIIFWLLVNAMFLISWSLKFELVIIKLEIILHTYIPSDA